jgi:hypothetical protein
MRKENLQKLDHLESFLKVGTMEEVKGKLSIEQIELLENARSLYRDEFRKNNKRGNLERDFLMMGITDGYSELGLVCISADDHPFADRKRGEIAGYFGQKRIDNLREGVEQMSQYIESRKKVEK